ncbi:MAG: response regulator transcription factor [Limisphaerales bacterium]
MDDHFMVRLGLRSLLEKQPGLRIVAEADSGVEALEQCARHQLDVVLMDVRMPEMNGVSATAAICKQYPAIKVIMLTTYEGDEDIFQALSAGARAYFLKTVTGDELVKGIRAVQAGEHCLPPEVASKLALHFSTGSLSPREREVLELIASGRGNKEIAEQLRLAENTVKNHVKAILEKLGAQDRTQAVSTAIQRGILHLQ